MATLAREALEWGAATDRLREALGYRSGRDAVLDSRGWTVRCTPMRRTVRIDLEDGSRIFAKHRIGRGSVTAAVTEWDALERVLTFGFRAPPRVFLARLGRVTVMGCESAPGRPADVVIDQFVGESGEVGRRRIEEWIRAVLAPRVRAMHEAGYCYRDLYWNHVFVGDGGETPFAAHSIPTLIDTERLFEPVGRMPRWIVKDLAGLISSWPAAADPAPISALCDACGQAELEAEIRRKAAGIRAHRPKFG